MLQTLVVKNFRSIRSARVSLRPLTVFVGANGSGKTNLLRAVELLGEILNAGTTEPVLDEGWENVAFRRRQTRTTMDLGARVTLPYRFDRSSASEARRAISKLPRLTIDVAIGLSHTRGIDDIAVRFERLRLTRRVGSRRTSLSLEIDREGAVQVEPGEDPALWEMVGRFAVRGRAELDSASKVRSLLEGPFERGDLAGATPGRLVLPRLFVHTTWWENLVSSCRVQRLRLDASAIRGMVVGYAGPISGQMGPAGEGLAEAVARLQQEDRFQPVLEAMQEILPRLESIRPIRARPRDRRLTFKEMGMSGWIAESAISDGTLHALALLVALQTRPRLSALRRARILALEEPENAIHPWAIGAVLNRANLAARRELHQVLVTTHSPTVVDAVPPQSLFIVEHSNGETSVTPATRLRRNLSKRLTATGMSLGEAWQRGLFGGVPSQT